ncbi:hypothetical protein [Archaeoglobus veneficus]|uniref:Uncharacterized protein n=2 Tax=root TaxID=1 RepID=F2KMG3_ARCVS|nr:hypothetical protein [Archaeoglobus veneficus]AEA46062.1 hypothetical protein Arcve_0018 [Archaeoglobus veneficus SNP6]
MSGEIVLLVGLFLAAWFFNSKLLKLATLAVFFFIPVVVGAVQFDLSSAYVSSVVAWWLQDLTQLIVQQALQQIQNSLTSVLPGLT